METFKIKLGATVDIKELTNEVLKLETIDIKLKFDLSGLENQVKNIFDKYGLGKMPPVEEKLKKGVPAVSAITQQKVTKTYYDQESNEIRELLSGYDELGNKITETNRIAKDGSKERISSIMEEGSLWNKNIETYSNLETRLNSLQKEGKITTKQAQQFKTELAKINNETNELKKKNAFKQLGQEISDSGKHALRFGEMLKTAFQKFAIWSVATVTWYGVIRVMKDVVKQSIEIDTAFTKLQMITQNTNAEMQELKKSYISLAKEMRVTLDVVTAGADEFLRAGLSATEATEALRASVVLSSVANMDSATSTQYLIAQMNAYGIEAKNLMSLVDKMSAVDIVAATSSAELGEALQQTAKSAQLAGVSYDDLLGMIATVSETTRKSASSIGNSFKTIFARLQQVKIGALVDDEGESISNVDKVLKNYNIDLMSTTNNLTDMGALLDLLGAKWKDYTAFQKSEIATTVAGVRQRENLIVLLDEYDRAMELSTVSTESAGSAMEKYNTYLESTQAKIDTFKTSWTGLINATVESDWFEWLIETGSEFLNFASKIGGLIPVLVELISVIGILKSIAKGSILGGVLGGIAIGGALIYQSFKAEQQKELSRVDEITQKSEQSINAIKEEETSVDELMKSYVELSSQNELTAQDTEKLIALRQELADAMGVEASVIEDNTTAYDKLNEAYAQYVQQGFMEKIAVKQGAIGEYSKDLADIQEELGPEELRVGDYDSKLYKAIRFFNKLAHEKAIDEATNKIAEYTKEISSLKKGLMQAQEVQNIFNKTLNEYQSWERSAKGVAKLETQLLALQGALKNITDEETLNRLNSFISIMKSDIEKFRFSDFALEYLDSQLKLLDEQKELEDRLADEKEKQEKISKSELSVQEALLDVEKKRAELAEAKNKKLKVFRAGQGLVYAEDSESVQSAQENLTDSLQSYSEALKSYQDTMAEVMGTATDKAIEAVKLLQEYYNKAQLDQVAMGSTALREYFQTPENLAKWSEMSYDDKLAFLKTFVTDKEWKPTSELNEEEIAQRGEEVTGGYTGGTNGEIGESVAIEALRESEKAKIEAQQQALLAEAKGLVAPYKNKTPAEIREFLQRGGFYNLRSISGDVAKLANAELQKILDSYTQDNIVKSGGIKMQKYHTGGIVGEKSFSSNNEMYAKLLKGEIVLKPNQFSDILGKVGHANSTTDKSITYNIGTIKMEGVDDVNGFIQQLTSKTVTRYTV